MGTLKVRAGHDRTKHFFFLQGHVADHMVCGALLGPRGATEKDIRLKKAAQKSESPSARHSSTSAWSH